MQLNEKDEKESFDSKLLSFAYIHVPILFLLVSTDKLIKIISDFVTIDKVAVFVFSIIILLIIYEFILRSFVFKIAKGITEKKVSKYVLRIYAALIFSLYFYNELIADVYKYKLIMLVLLFLITISLLLLSE